MAKVATRTWKHNGEEKTAYVVRYVDERGVRRSKQFDKFKPADAYRRKVEAEIDAGTHLASGAGASIAECCKNFMESAELRMARGQIGRSRYEFYGAAIRKHISPALGKKLISDLSWADLDEWQNSLGELSPTSIQSVTTVFKLVEEHAFKRGHLKKKVIQGFKREAGSARPVKIRTFTAETATALIRAAATLGKGRRVRVHAMTECGVHLACFCGLRYGEFMGLTLNDIDFDRRIIRVRHSLTLWDLLKSPKTAAGLRDVPMPVHIGQLLRDWISQHYVENERQIVFRARGGGLVGPGNWREYSWWPLLKDAGLWSDDGDQLHFHACRHFAASWMIEHGLALPDVASLMGHSKFDMTLQVYAHPIVGGHRRHEAFDRMTGSLLSAVQATSPLDATQRLPPPQN